MPTFHQSGTKVGIFIFTFACYSIHIFIIRSEADPFSKISSRIGKLLYILNSSIYLLNGLYCHFFIVFRNILFNVLQVLCHNRINP